MVRAGECRATFYNDKGAGCVEAQQVPQIKPMIGSCFETAAYEERVERQRGIASVSHGEQIRAEREVG